MSERGLSLRRLAPASSYQPGDRARHPKPPNRSVHGASSRVGLSVWLVGVRLGDTRIAEFARLIRLTVLTVRLQNLTEPRRLNWSRSRRPCRQTRYAPRALRQVRFGS